MIFQSKGLSVMILNIKKLYVAIDNKQILNGVNLHIPDGEVHAIMGPNGSGKSTLAMVLAGHPKYTINSGNILFNDENISHLSPDKRAKAGIFLGFQHPLEIAGINNAYFFRTILKANPYYKNINTLNISSFIEEYMLKLGLHSEFLKREVNCGFSGGEKKRNEIMQMMILRPKLSVLDEIDSGLDIDALKFVSVSIHNFLKINPHSSILLITHYSQLFKYIQPHCIHVMRGGEIICTGTMDLVKKIEIHGYQVI